MTRMMLQIPAPSIAATRRATKNRGSTWKNSVVRIRIASSQPPWNPASDPTHTPITVEVTYHGGFLNDTEGVFNSEAPSADDVKVGNRVLAFYAWRDNMGGGVAANALIAAHGGLFRAVEGPGGATVLGRGQGYAVNQNVRVSSLETALGTLYVAKKK